VSLLGTLHTQTTTEGQEVAREEEHGGEGVAQV
jgi:hypothetical protein